MPVTFVAPDIETTFIEDASFRYLNNCSCTEGGIGGSCLLDPQIVASENTEDRQDDDESKMLMFHRGSHPVLQNSVKTIHQAGYTTYPLLLPSSYTNRCNSSRSCRIMASVCVAKTARRKPPSDGHSPLFSQLQMVE